MLEGARVLALLPGPDQLSVMPTATALIDQQLFAHAKPSSVLAATSLSLAPRRLMQAATHALT